MGCSRSELTFQDNQTVVVSVVKSGPHALLNVQNQGRNVVEIRRVLLGWISPSTGWSSTLYLRPPPDPISWIYPYDTVEPNYTALFYVLHSLSPGDIVQAQAEYIEIDGRSRSCSITM